MRPKKGKREEGEGKKAFLLLSSPSPPRPFACAIFRAVFDSCSSFFAPKPHRKACYSCYLVGSPGGPGGEVLPIMESFFSNNGQIMHMNIISLILVWHCCWASNTRWLEKILKKKDWEPYSATNIRSFTTLNLPTMKTNKQQQQNNKIYVSWCIKWKADFVPNWFAISTQLSNHLLITCNGQTLFYLASLR